MIIDGEIVLDLANPVQQGPMGEFARKLSAEMMELSDEDLEDCALSIMSLIERFMNGGEVYMEGTGDEKFADVEEFCGFISVGIPLILKTAITTEEGRAAVGSIAMDAISGLATSENGGKMIIAMCAVVLICAPAVVVLGQTIITAGVGIWKGATLVDSVLGLFDDTFELSDVKGAAIVAKVIAKAAMFLASNPHIVVAVLAIVAVVALVTYIGSDFSLTVPNEFQRHRSAVQLVERIGKGASTVYVQEMAASGLVQFPKVINHGRLLAAESLQIKSQ